MTEFKAFMFDMVLVGANEGQTVRYGDHTFVKGRCRMKVPAHAVDFFIRKMAVSHNAHPENSKALVEARAKWEALKKELAKREEVLAAAAKESGNGVLGGLLAPAQSGSADGVQGEGGRERSAEQAGPSGPQGSDEAPGGAARLLPLGDGLQDARDAGVPAEDGEGSSEPQPAPIDPGLVIAIRKLDTGNDKHWTAEGLPDLGAVETAYGTAGLTRDMVAQALPGFTREAAMAASFNA